MSDKSTCEKERDKAIEALEIINRNIKAGAVSIYWCGEFAKRKLEEIKQIRGNNETESKEQERI